MTVVRIQTISLQGMNVVTVDVEVQIGNGLPRFIIVGLPDAIVSESRVRIMSALNFCLPPKNIVVNLLPSHIRKERSHYDLPIALCLLVALNMIPEAILHDYIAIGGLALDGSITSVCGALPAAMHANALNKGLICPTDCIEAAILSGITGKILAPSNIIELINYFKGTGDLLTDENFALQQQYQYITEENVMNNNAEFLISEESPHKINLEKHGLGALSEKYVSIGQDKNQSATNQAKYNNTGNISRDIDQKIDKYNAHSEKLQSSTSNINLDQKAHAYNGQSEQNISHDSAQKADTYNGQSANLHAQQSDLQNNTHTSAESQQSSQTRTPQNLDEKTQFIKSQKKYTSFEQEIGNKYPARAVHILRDHTNTLIKSQKKYADWEHIRGQESAKRAALISLVGGHHLLLIGSPGSGKSMIAQSMSTLLPELVLDMALETTILYNLRNNIHKLILKPPFREPHHGASMSALIGGGVKVLPGEISLANGGILFMDEFPEFNRQVLDSLREPMENGIVIISRANGSITYPAKFQLVAAMNPCRCGMSDDRSCVIGPRCRQMYMSRISGPLLDRFDLCARTKKLLPWELVKNQFSSTTSSTESEIMTSHAHTPNEKTLVQNQNNSLTSGQTMHHLSTDNQHISEQTFEQHAHNPSIDSNISNHMNHNSDGTSGHPSSTNHNNYHHAQERHNLNEDMINTIDAHTHTQHQSEHAYDLDHLNTQQAKKLIALTRDIQIQRQHCLNVHLDNENLNNMLSQDDKNFLEGLCKKYELSGRGYYRMLRVARTIDDMTLALNILNKHDTNHTHAAQIHESTKPLTRSAILEAVSYRIAENHSK